jgi:protein-S-isoprenylcysteine O-methyltransferase Ste14
LPVPPVWQAVGATSLFGGSLLMAVAQLRMGKSWRIGIDPDARPGLITTGLYRFSRNPIYVGTFLCSSGFTVLLPTWVSLVLFVLTIARVRWQVRQEEAYLIRAYGDEYLAYARRVGRFVPGMGRLA